MLSFSKENVATGSKSNLHYIRYITAKRVARSVTAAQRAGYAALKKRRNGGEPLATLCRFDRPGNLTPNLPHRERVRLTTKLNLFTNRK